MTMNMIRITRAKSLLEGSLKNFIGPNQRSVLSSNLRGEEGRYFADMLIELQEKIDAMPVLYGQEDLDDAAVVHLHYFLGSIDAWVTEKYDGETDPHDPEDYDRAFGYRKINGEAELGYMSIKEMIECGVELDLYWEPKTLKEVK